MSKDRTLRLALLACSGVLCWATAASADFTLTLNQPTNKDDQTAGVQVLIPNDNGFQMLNYRINIPAQKTIKEKRDLISTQLEGPDNAREDRNKGLPRLTIAKPDDKSLTIQGLAKGSGVNYFPGKTGEGKEALTVARTDPIASFGFQNSSPFESHDADGAWSVFYGGVITDVGELSASVSAQYEMG